MAVIRAPQQMPAESGPGWRRAVLAEPSAIPGLPLRAERVRLDPAASTPTAQAGEETMLYVIAGSGHVHVGETSHRVEPETVVWLTTGDHFSLRAGGSGLDVLIGTAAEPSRDP